MNLLDRLDTVPPMLCRLLARRGHGRVPMSNKQIAERSGLAKSTVVRIGRMRSWAKLEAITVSAFSSACGVDLLAPASKLKYMRRSRQEYFRHATKAQREMYARLISGLSGNRLHS